MDIMRTIKNSKNTTCLDTENKISYKHSSYFLVSIFFLTFIIFNLLIPSAHAQEDTDSTLFSRSIAKIFLGLFLLGGLSFAAKFFLDGLANDPSLAAPVKYLLITIIWVTIFLILFFILSNYIMDNWYPSS